MSGVAFYLVGINIEEPVVSLILINTISVVLSLVVVFVLTKRKNLVSEMELNITRVYGGMFEDVISDIRRKQHNYKEQIAAIYSTHKTAQSLDELIECQKGYCDMLQEDSKYDFILTACHEPILAGFIYYKCLDCLSKNIIVECNIRVNQWNCEIKLYELIEVLGRCNRCCKAVLFKMENRRIFSL